MYFVLVAILCLLSVVGLGSLFGIVRLHILTSSSTPPYLVLPLGEDCDSVEQSVRCALLHLDTLNTSLTKLVVVDLGLGDSDRKILETFVSQKSVVVVSPEQLKNVLLYSRI